MKKITLIALNCFLTVIFYAAYAGLPPEITYVLDNCHSQAQESTEKHQSQKTDKRTEKKLYKQQLAISKESHVNNPIVNPVQEQNQKQLTMSETDQNRIKDKKFPMLEVFSYLDGPTLEHLRPLNKKSLGFTRKYELDFSIKEKTVYLDLEKYKPPRIKAYFTRNIPPSIALKNIGAITLDELKDIFSTSKDQSFDSVIALRVVLQTQEDAQILSDFLYLEQLPFSQLKYLTIEESYHTKEKILDLKKLLCNLETDKAELLAKLEEFSLICYQLSGKSPQQLNNAISKMENLKKLYLHTSITKNNQVHIMGALKHLAKLEVLELSDWLSSNDALKILGSALENMQQLRDLSIRITAINEDNTKLLAERFRNSEKLESLDISLKRKTLSQNSQIALANGISSIQKLRELLIDSYGEQNDLMSTLLPKLSFITNLKVLALDIVMSKEEKTTLIESLPNLQKVKFLRLSINNNNSRPITERLGNALQNMPKLKKLQVNVGDRFRELPQWQSAKENMIKKEIEIVDGDLRGCEGVEVKTLGTTDSQRNLFTKPSVD